MPAIPAFLNPQAGTAERIREILSNDGRFRTVEHSATELPGAVREEVAGGASRVVIAGGDGTVAAAAGALAGTGTELALLPAGTLNHFARAHGVPTEPAAALDLAARGAPRGADAGFVNGHLFLNTSSVGAYVSMVRLRERLRPRLGYHLAGAFSAISLFLNHPCIPLVLERDGSREEYRTPLLFVGVGRREVSLRRLGERAEERAHRLHAIVIRGGGRARLLSLAFTTATRGLHRSARTPHLDSALVERCRVELPDGEIEVAMDGETLHLRSPLEYRIERDALRLVARDAAETGR